MTPEGKVKKKVTALIKKMDATYYHMPVQNGMGRPTLDYIGCCNGLYFAVETKSPGKRPTPRQCLTISEITDAGGIVFVISNEDELNDFRQWLEYAQSFPTPHLANRREGAGIYSPCKDGGRENSGAAQTGGDEDTS